MVASMKQGNIRPASVSIRSAGVFLAALMLAGCATRPDLATDPAPPADQQPAAAEAHAAGPAGTRIREGALLNISVHVGGRSEIDASGTRVSETGTIDLPLLGTMRIAGHPIAVVRRYLARAYSKYYVEPQVFVEVAPSRENNVFPWGYVTVLGRVKQQGRVAIPPTQDMTVTSAIQQAGGFDTSARINAIRVTRSLPNDKTETMQVDLRAVGARGQADDDIALQPNDIVFVPEQLF